VLRRRWRLVALAVLLCVGGSLVVTSLTQPTYAARTKMFVSAQDGGASDGAATNAYQLSLLSQQRVTSYADLVSGPRIAQNVVEDLRLPISAANVQSKISASAPLNTVIIGVTVRDTDRARAQSIANAVGTQLSVMVEQLERPRDGGPSLVKISVVEPAELPAAPVSPRRSMNLAIGLALGLAAGAVAAVMRDNLDTTVKSTSDISALVDAPTLGVIGFDPEMPRRPLVVQSDPRSPRAEAFRQLRTNLQFVDIDDAPRTIVVTSALAGEGKSTLTCNLALALAQVGLRVVVVEGDLRRPQVAEFMGIEGAVGLTSVLIGQVPLSDAVQPWGTAGRLLVLPSGPIPPNPAELLGSRGMSELLTHLRSMSDVVLIDAPPVLPVTDAATVCCSRYEVAEPLVTRSATPRLR
jgi:non-specific protein-tyrosine kinase